MDKFNTYTLKRRKGIDDLKTLYAWHGASQGDESVSNILEDGNEWMSWAFGDIPRTQEAIDAEVQIRKRWNEEYVERLKKNGDYGKEYELTIHIKPNPIFDRSQFKTVSSSLETHKLMFVDMDGKLKEAKDAS